jgi:hypothetical protein
MANGRTLRLYLVDGSPSGLITAELGNWSGKALVGPRTRLADLLKRPEASRTGVYLLVGPDPSVTGRVLVYVGESDSVADRLRTHEKESKWDFSRMVMFVSKDDNLTKAHVRYLESKLIAAISASQGAKLVNGTAPIFSLLPEAEIADMDVFLDHVLTLLPVLGFDVVKSQTPADSAGVVFELKTTFLKAAAVERGDEFVVLAGSYARKDGVPSWPAGTRALRDALLADGLLAPSENEALYRFTEDAGFSSPSAAASVVTGRTEQGPAVWKVKGSKMTYADWRASTLPQA